MLGLLILIPVFAGICAFVVPLQGVRRAIFLMAAFAHSAITFWSWTVPPGTLAALDSWLLLDAPGRLFLSVTSLLFLMAAIYTVGYLAREKDAKHKDIQEGVLFANAPEAVFIGCLMFFLATMSLVTVSQHLGLIWVATEATTLASAPLIYFHRHHRSLEATWKYLLICSVGIALALLGNFFLALSSATQGSASLMLSDLLKEGMRLDRLWLNAGFLCLLVGYGTKMGLAPMHTWLPDAHSEAPSVVSALLSGALLNCAFLSIFRALQVCHAAGQGPFAQKLLMTFGLISIFLAAIFILAQADYKRMLAYSSVEHMGIVALGVGIGGTAVFGAMLHAVNHSLTKAMLFLVAGNILEAYRTKMVKDVRGVSRVLPWSGFFWIVGLLAISGYPPFGPFMSKFIILKEALAQGYYAPAIIFIALLAMIFIGMSTVVLGMAQGNPPAGIEPRRKEPWSAVAPLAVFAILVLILGVYIPPFFENTLHEIAHLLGGM